MTEYSLILNSGKKVNIRHFLELPSTNTYLKELPCAKSGRWLAVIADRQSAGRGRLGRSFSSEENCGLYMSLLITDPNILDPTHLTAAAGVAAAEAIEKVIGVSCGIKWVNDLYYNEKKVCGILAEGVIAPCGSLSSAVIGIGINIAEPHGGYNEEIKDIAGALTDEYSLETRDRLAHEVLNALDNALTHCTELHRKYKARSIVICRDVTVISASESYKATAVDIEEDFGLIVRTQSGKEITLHSGEISVRI